MWVFDLMKDLEDSGMFETEEEQRKICSTIMRGLSSEEGWEFWGNKISRRWVYSLFPEHYKPKRKMLPDGSVSP